MRRINVTVPGELLARAKAAGINLSEVTRNALAQAVHTQCLHEAASGDDAGGRE